MSELIDNRAHRIRTLKEVIRHLHEGKAPAEVKARLAALVRECDASEIAAMEQELMAEGVPVQEIMGMCDLHSQVVRDILVEKASAPPPPGHPVDTFRRENEALRAQAASLRSALATLAPEGADEEAPVDPAHHLVCRRLFSGLMDVEKHYQRKENLLFSFLERHGITGPSTVMWGKDDEARALLRELGNALAETGGTAGEWQLVARTVAEPALAAVEEMIFKEERILLPMALQTLTATEWGEIFTESPGSATASSTRARATSRRPRRATCRKPRAPRPRARASPSPPSPPARAPSRSPSRARRARRARRACRRRCARGGSSSPPAS